MQTQIGSYRSRKPQLRSFFPPPPNISISLTDLECRSNILAIYIYIYIHNKYAPFCSFFSKIFLSLFFVFCFVFSCFIFLDFIVFHNIKAVAANNELKGGRLLIRQLKIDDGNRSGVSVSPTATSNISNKSNTNTIKFNIADKSQPAYSFGGSLLSTCEVLMRELSPFACDPSNTIKYKTAILNRIIGIASDVQAIAEMCQSRKEFEQEQGREEGEEEEEEEGSMRAAVHSGSKKASSSSFKSFKSSISYAEEERLRLLAIVDVLNSIAESGALGLDRSSLDSIRSLASQVCCI